MEIVIICQVILFLLCFYLWWKRGHAGYMFLVGFTFAQIVHDLGDMFFRVR